MNYFQPPLIEAENTFSDLENALDFLAKATTNRNELGSIFTRQEIAEFMLNIAEYTTEKDLTRYSLLEPACGQGDFLFLAVERLLRSYFLHKKDAKNAYPDLINSIRAVEINTKTYELTKLNLIQLLEKYDIEKQDAQNLAESWLINNDFLLSHFTIQFTHIIGNPPYVRQELLNDALIKEYRKRYKTIYDRADLYIPFIEYSLSLLDPMGKLVFICPDRWMKNKYGGPLRKLISSHFHLHCYINMVHADAFHKTVIAYPGIFSITAQKSTNTFIIQEPEISSEGLQSISNAVNGKPQQSTSSTIQIIKEITASSQPWLFCSTENEQKLLHRLEHAFPLLEDAKCRVGIGVATGCDKVFIGNRENLPIEDDRKLPLLTTKDIQTGRITWSGKVVVNPFDENGNLIHLHDYPKLKTYFLAHEEAIKNRHVAKKRPQEWYRTIDKIHTPLTFQPKLLIPDIKGEPLVIYDEGNYYPHHNLYYVTSSTWNLLALKAVLQSTISNFFVATYSVQMHGGYLRFQAQNIRRIRLPQWEDVSEDIRARLIQAGKNGNTPECDEIIFDLYKLSQEEIEIFTAI